MTNEPGSHHSNHHCTLAVVRALTKPLLFPPTTHNDELKRALMLPWNVRVPVDPTDYTTRSHWQNQKHTALFHAMFDWEPHNTSPQAATASLHPYFSFDNPSSPFFAPWQDAGNCLKHLMLHRIASHHEPNKFIVLTSREIDLFIATSPTFQEQSDDLERIRKKLCSRVRRNGGYYLLRCHYDKSNKQLMFGYHSSPAEADEFRRFHTLVEISLLQDEWRLTTCIVLKNLARILHCLQDYSAPLVWSSNRKLTAVHHHSSNNNGDGMCIQKIYKTENICNIFNATVSNMISIYQTLEKAQVPHTDRLVAMEEKKGERICRFSPIGRSYKPQNLQELLDSLICISEALVALHAIGIMHRDIRWANVFHAFPTDSSNTDNGNSVDNAHTLEHDLADSHEWVLFDFEFAAFAPQPAFGAHTLTPGNHAPEMVVHPDDETAWNSCPGAVVVKKDDEVHPEHGLATNIWGLGFLLLHASVDVPASHAPDLLKLQSDCLRKNPVDRPTAAQCLDLLRNLKKRPPSTEKDIAEHL